MFIFVWGATLFHNMGKQQKSLLLEMLKFSI